MSDPELRRIIEKVREDLEELDRLEESRSGDGGDDGDDEPRPVRKWTPRIIKGGLAGGAIAAALQWTRKNKGALMAAGSSAAVATGAVMLVGPDPAPPQVGPPPGELMSPTVTVPPTSGTPRASPEATITTIGPTATVTGVPTIGPTGPTTIVPTLVPTTLPPTVPPTHVSTPTVTETATVKPTATPTRTVTRTVTTNGPDQGGMTLPTLPTFSATGPTLPTFSAGTGQ